MATHDSQELGPLQTNGRVATEVTAGQRATRDEDAALAGEESGHVAPAAGEERLARRESLAHVDDPRRQSQERSVPKRAARIALKWARHVTTLPYTVQKRQRGPHQPTLLPMEDAIVPDRYGFDHYDFDHYDFDRQDLDRQDPDRYEFDRDDRARYADMYDADMYDAEEPDELFPEDASLQRWSAALREHLIAMETLANAATEAASKEEAGELMAAATTLVLQLVPQVYQPLWPFLPVLIRSTVGVTRDLHSRESTRRAIAQLPLIQVRAVEKLAEDVAAMRPITQKLVADRFARAILVGLHSNTRPLRSTRR